MTDVDPKIWENPTLGAAGAGPFLDEVDAQAREDYNARREGREPRVAYHVDRYPKYPDLNVPSSVSTFEMLSPDEVPVEESLPVEEDNLSSPVEEDPTSSVDLDNLFKDIDNDSEPTE
jgi:hypothetical protein